VEIGPELKRGNNSIAVLVWYWGKNGFSYNTSGKAGLVFEADGADQEIVSDATWKMLIHPAFENTGLPHPNFRLSEFNIGFDARRDIADWMLPRFNDAGWPAPAVFGFPPVAPWNHLEKRPIPQWKNSGLKPYVSVETTTNKNGGPLLKARLPYDAQVTPCLKVCAPAGQRIDIRTDDYKGGGTENVRAVYITREGTQEFESPGWMNGHEVRYSAPAAVKFLGVKYRETGYNANFVGAFHCDDEKLNILWEKARRTLYVTMRDNYMDCPDRERAQWWGDMVNELGENFYVFDSTNGPLLARKGILELARWQRADHTLYAPIPSGKPKNDVRKDPGSGNWNSELPPQMLASIGKYGFWTYYMYTGDKQTITEVYPHVRDYLNVWKLNDDGLVIHRAGDWDWEDWGENIDEHVMDSAWYYLALQGAMEMAYVSGHEDEDVPIWKSRMGSIRTNFNAKFWTGSEYRSSGYHGDTDDRANALAVVAGLADTNNYEHLRKVFAKHFNASPYMEKYVLEALYQMHAPDQAIQRMKQRWASQIDSPLTTLWEGWGIGTNGYGGGTYNHAWSGGALTALSQYAAGVGPDTPAFDSYHVVPQMGALTSVHSVVPTPKGEIRVDLRKEAGVFDLRLTSPASTSALVGIPTEAEHSIGRVELNGKTVWIHGVTRTFSGYFLWDDEKGHLGFVVPPGKWHFKAYMK